MVLKQSSQCEYVFDAYVALTLSEIELKRLLQQRSYRKY